MRTPFSITIIISGFCDNLFFGGFFRIFLQSLPHRKKCPMWKLYLLKWQENSSNTVHIKKIYIFTPFSKNFDICQKTNSDTGTLWIFNINPYKRYMACQNIALKLQPSVIKNC